MQDTLKVIIFGVNIQQQLGAFQQSLLNKHVSLSIVGGRGPVTVIQISF